VGEAHDPASAPLAAASTAVSPIGEPERAVGDPLSDVLQAVRLTGALFFLAEGSSPYAAEAPSGQVLAPAILPGAQQIVSYHLVREGGCWVTLPGGAAATWLGPGDVLVIPHGDPYLLSNPSQARSPLSPDENREVFRMLARGQLPALLVEGEGEPCVRLVCGFLGCDVLPFNPVLAALPRALVVRRSPTTAAPPAGEDRLAQLVELAVQEAHAPRPGSACMLLRLGELLFVEVVRRHLAGLPAEESGWLAGLRDPFVGRALRLLHTRSAEPWTLAGLAHESGLSRSSLAARFMQLVGVAPMQYLTRWRMQLAARLLTDGNGKVAAVAHAVGYESEAAFSRAFKKLVGSSPAVWRRRGARTG
jgi:AraC-like DNA-binding protein